MVRRKREVGESQSLEEIGREMQVVKNPTCDCGKSMQHNNFGWFEICSTTPEGTEDDIRTYCNTCISSIQTLISNWKKAGRPEVIVTRL